MAIRRRTAVLGALSVALALTTGAVGSRLVAPGETLSAAKGPYSAQAATTEPRMYGILLRAPLVVDDRLRISAALHQVAAEAPVNAPSSVSPFWSFRRWPAELIGVVAVGTRVITQWSDGVVVALSAPKGTITWRDQLDRPTQAHYNGRRTGAATVYDPRYLFTAGGTVIAVSANTTTAYDAMTGQHRWQQPLGDCPGAFTTTGLFICPGHAVVDAVSGRRQSWPVSRQARPQPVGCAVGHSGCTGLRLDTHGWLINADGQLTPAPALADPSGWLVDDTVVRPQADGTLVSFNPAGTPLWTWTGGAGQLIAVEPRRIYVLAHTGELVTLAATNGQEISRVALFRKEPYFDVGWAYATGRFVFIERLRRGARPSVTDNAYYYPSPSVLLAGT